MAQDDNTARTNGRPSTINGAETVIAPRPLVAPSVSSYGDSMRKEARKNGAFIEGSTPHMSAETRDLLRNRLRLSAILFFIGFSAFLIRSLFSWDELVLGNLPLFVTHSLVAI